MFRQHSFLVAMICCSFTLPMAYGQLPCRSSGAPSIQIDPKRDIAEYHAGDTVHLLATGFACGRSFRLRVTLADGQVVVDQQAVAADYGDFRHSFVLPGDTPEGNQKIEILDALGNTLASELIHTGSHFRGGFMSAQVSGSGVVTFTAETLWRKAVAGDGATFPVSGVTRSGLAAGFFPIQVQILRQSDRVVLRDSSNLFFGVLPDPVAAAPGADLCTDAVSISGVGRFAFDNSAATTDGVPDASCDQFATGDFDVELDVWFSWTADFTGTASFSTCGLTGIDSKIAVYDGNTCPSGSGILACNDDACGPQSSVSVPVVNGQVLLIRLGSFTASPGGAGELAITNDAIFTAPDILATTDFVDTSDPQLRSPPADVQLRSWRTRARSNTVHLRRVK